MFSYFDVDPTALPTVVYTHVEHNKYGVMIGKFDKESIEEHEEKFKNGRLPLQDIKVDKRELEFSEIDCQAQFLSEVVDEDDDFEEILAEILAEEKARRDAEEAESGSSPKKSGGKKKKGKGKKAKKGKKNFESEDLWTSINHIRHTTLFLTRVLVKQKYYQKLKVTLLTLTYFLLKSTISMFWVSLGKTYFSWNWLILKELFVITCLSEQQLSYINIYLLIKSLFLLIDDFIIMCCHRLLF